MSRPARRPGGAGRSVARNAAIVAAAFALGRVLGMVREIVIAARFGTGETYDAYVAAFRIPDLLFALVISGAFGAAFIPVFGGLLARDDGEKAWRLASSMLTWTVVALAALAAVIFALAGPLIDTVVAPELSPDGRDLAVQLTRLLLLSPLLLGLGAAAKGMLEAQDAFTLPAIAPLLYNLGIIFGAVALAPAMGIHGLVAGVLFGAVAHAGIQLGALVRDGLRFRPSLDRDTEGMGEVLRLMAPRVVGQGASQVNLIVVTNLASRLGEGSISALNYANQLVLLPHGVLAMSLSTVIFPRMAREFATGQTANLRRTLVDGLGPLVFLVLPATIVLIAFRTSIVQVLFQYGSFDADSTALVATGVALLGIGLLGRALIEPVTRAFYAMRDTRTPVAVSVGSVAVNIALGWWLSSRYGFTGLALSMSLTYTLRALLLVALLSRRTDGAARDLGLTLVRLLPPAAAMAAVAALLAGPLAAVTDPARGREVLDYLIFGIGVVLAGATYLVIAWAFRVPELATLVGLAERRLGGRVLLPRR